jgi:hypothetical protein
MLVFLLMTVHLVLYWGLHEMSMSNISLLNPALGFRNPIQHTTYKASLIHIDLDASPSPVRSGVSRSVNTLILENIANFCSQYHPPKNYGHVMCIQNMSKK